MYRLFLRVYSEEKNMLEELADFDRWRYGCEGERESKEGGNESRKLLNIYLFA